MTIAEEITRLSNAKAAIKQSIANKGVEVSDSALLDEYPALIDSIEVGSGGGGDPYYEDFYNLRTSNGTNMSGLFAYCTAPELDLSNLDTSKVTDMSSMFYGCKSSVNIDGWDTSRVTTMEKMFYSFSGSIDETKLDTSKVITMNSMFYSSNIKELDLSNFNTDNVTDISSMFVNCTSLITLNVSNWNIGKITSMSMLFYNCNKLTALDLSSWDISKVTTLSNAFASCSALVDFIAPKNISVNMDVSKSTKLSHDSLMGIINNLATVTSSKTLTLGTTNLAKLTDEELAIATNKGWKIA